MKILFIESKRKFNPEDYAEKAREISSLIKADYNLLYSVQYKELAEWLKDFLLKKHKKALISMQVLGCSKLKINNNAPIIFVGSGRFHALQIAAYNNSDIILFPSLSKIEKKDIELFNNKKKALISKFLISENIGILVSTKPGQEEIKKALLLKQKIENSGKKAFIFISDYISIGETENFNIDFWINTACPRISFSDSFAENILNEVDILQYLIKK